MRNDAINMEVNEGLLAFGAEEEGAVFGACAGQIERFLLQSLPKKMQNNRVHQPKMSIISHYLGTIYEKPPQTTLRGFFVEHRRIELLTF